MNGDFSAAAVLISFGAVIGRASPIQLLIMATIEVVLLTVNEYIGLDVLKVSRKNVKKLNRTFLISHKLHRAMMSVNQFMCTYLVLTLV